MSWKLVLFGCFLVLIHFYAWKAMQHMWTFEVGVIDRILKGLFYLFGLYTLVFLGLMFAGLVTQDQGVWLNYAFSLFIIWLGCLIAFCFFLLIDDLRRALFWAIDGIDPQQPLRLRSRFLYNLGAMASLIPFVAFTYGMIRNMYNFKKRFVRVPVADLPEDLEGLRIIQISDAHLGTFARKEPIREAVQAINAEKPDLILFTGDLVNEIADEVLPFLDILSGLKAKYGVFSILGNHDYADYVADQSYDKASHMERMKTFQKKMGWTLLRDENRLLQIGKAKLGIIGMENASAKSYFRNYGSIDNAYPGSEKADIKLLMTHDPSYWRPHVLKKYGDIALTLSGHTHGMQCGIEIPGFIKWSPAKYVYNEWAGLYTENNQHLYVNRGFGCLGYPGRVGIMPEISILELSKS